MKYIAIDVETTGTHPYRDQIIEFGAVIDDLSNPKPLSELRKFQCIVPHEFYRGSAIALNMNKEIIEILAEFDKISDKQYQDKKDFMEKHNIIYPDDLGYYFVEFLIKNDYYSHPAYDRAGALDINKTIERIVNFNKGLYITPAGKNFTNFDKKFIENHFVIHPSYINIGKYINFTSRCLDPVSIYTRPEDKQLPNSKTCRERAGLSQIENTHRAIQDSLDVIQMIRKHILGYVEPNK